MKDRPPNFSVATLAEHWDVCRETVRKRIRDGELGAFQNGRLVRIPVAEVEKFEQRNMIVPEPAGTEEAPIEEMASEEKDPEVPHDLDRKERFRCFRASGTYLQPFPGLNTDEREPKFP